MNDINFLEFYKEFLNCVKTENLYLKNNEEIDYIFINNLVMKKKISKDKINKARKKLKVDEYQNIKKEIEKIIKESIFLEEENKTYYEKKINYLKKNLTKTVNEKKVKQAYFKSGREGNNYFDQKK